MKFSLKSCFSLLFLFSLCTNKTIAQDSVTVMFYNVENLFDTSDDSTKNDNEFLPDSKKRWTNSKWKKKTYKISQVIAAANFPDIIGLCEVENKIVLEKLTKSNLLWRHHYKILHIESNDKRGIDVALLYKENKLDLYSVKANPIHLSGARATRDILSATFLHHSDTFSVFVNHWPSRYGGKKKSIPKRIKASIQLKHLLDSVRFNHSNHKSIAMGDFNDEPNDSSLKVFKDFNFPLSNSQGTIKYKGKWQNFDQFILSKNSTVASKVLRFDFLLEEDKKYGGLKPFRTYYGPRYNNGFSDHLPIYLKIESVKKVDIKKGSHK